MSYFKLKLCSEMDLVKNTVNKFNENVFKFLYLLNKNLQKNTYRVLVRKVFLL